jgi:hypothetical protein
MARDSKQVFRFAQQAFSTANLLTVSNYGMSATLTSGALHLQTATGSANHYFQGVSNTINRAGFRDTNADQSILVSGETSAIANDPALFGNTNGAERYVHAIVQTYGVMGTSNFELLLQGASDTGVGTAGTDWTQISGSVALVSQVNGEIPSTGTTVSSGEITTTAAHGLSVGDVIFPRSSNGTLVAWEPLVVVSVISPVKAGLARVAGGVVLTTLTGSGVVFSKPTFKRVVSVPIGPSVKPWVRVMVRATAPPGGQVPAPTGAFVDQVYLTMGRDTAAVG